VVIAPYPVNLESVIKSAVELLSPQAQAKGLTVDVHLETLPDRALADDTRIHQILLNFMSNAMKFTSQGSVTVEARYNLDDERLCCQVTDTGPGIPADRLDRLFKRFSQVDASTTRAYGGTGLGRERGGVQRLGRGQSLLVRNPLRDCDRNRGAPGLGPAV
jgi:signal transduction histidine kinase